MFYRLLSGFYVAPVGGVRCPYGFYKTLQGRATRVDWGFSRSASVVLVEVRASD